MIAALIFHYYYLLINVASVHFMNHENVPNLNSPDRVWFKKINFMQIPIRHFFLLAFSPPIRHSHFNSEKQFNSWIVWNVEQKRFVRRMSFITIIIVIVSGKKSRYGCWYAKCVSYSVVSATNTRRNLKYSRVRVFILLPAESKKTETKTNDNVGASCWVVAWFILM